MARIGWSPEARRDLRDVHDWIARDSSRYAAVAVSRIRAGVQHLRRFRESGRTIPELPSGPYRHVIVGQYPVIYRFDHEGDAVIIVSVVHGTRNLPEIADRS